MIRKLSRYFLASASRSRPDEFNRGIMRTQNKPFVVEIKKAKRATDAPAETPAPRGAAPSSSIWSSVPEPSQPPLTASAARRAADALFDFTPKASRKARPAVPVARKAPVVDAAPVAEALPASLVTPSPKGRVLWVERPEPAAAAVDEISEAVPARRGRGRPRKIVVPADAEAPAVEAPARGEAGRKACWTPASRRRACDGRSRPRSPFRRRCTSHRRFPCSAPCADCGRRNCRAASAGRTAFRSSAAEKISAPS